MRRWAFDLTAITGNIAQSGSIFAIGLWRSRGRGGDDAPVEPNYRCSETGLAAWRDEDPELAAEERQLLALLQREGGSVQRLRRHADRMRLADLAARGLIVPS